MTAYHDRLTAGDYLPKKKRKKADDTTKDEAKTTTETEAAKATSPTS